MIEDPRALMDAMVLATLAASLAMIDAAAQELTRRLAARDVLVIL